MIVLIPKNYQMWVVVCLGALSKIPRVIIETTKLFHAPIFCPECHCSMELFPRYSDAIAPNCGSCSVYTCTPFPVVFMQWCTFWKLSEVSLKLGCLFILWLWAFVLLQCVILLFWSPLIQRHLCMWLSFECTHKLWCLGIPIINEIGFGYTQFLNFGAHVFLVLNHNQLPSASGLGT